MRKREIVFKEAADADVLSARDWYRERSSVLAEQFANEVAASIESISNSPEMFQRVYRDIRRALTSRFPYAIYFIMSDSGPIIILRVLHQARDPQQWKRP